MRTSLTHTDKAVLPSPIDMVEELVLSEDWNIERRGDCEVVVERPGTGKNFDMFFVWSKELNSLQITCVLDAFVNKPQEPSIFAALARTNEMLWTGHFSLWAEEGMIVYRNSLLLDRDGLVNEDTLGDAVNAAIEESERFYPLFDFVLKHGEISSKMTDILLLPAQGEA